MLENEEIVFWSTEVTSNYVVPGLSLPEYFRDTPSLCAFDFLLFISLSNLKNRFFIFFLGEP